MILLPACGNDASSGAATQVVARVNGEEITVHQVNHALSRSAVVAPANEPAAKRLILERLIDQQVARQRAIERKLDRTPAAIQSMEAAKTDILARAYLEQAAAGRTAPSDEELRAYYRDNPHLFARRKLFAIEELSLMPQKGVRPIELKQYVAQARDLRHVAAWLKASEVLFDESRGVRPAEQLPLDWLPGVQKMVTGQMLVFETGERLHVIRLAGTQAAPVDEAVARPHIRQYLSNLRLSDAIARELKQIREHAKIEYLGEFARAPNAVSPAPQPGAAPDLPQKEQRTIDKAIRGLR